MQNIVILGAGEHGRSVLEIYRAQNQIHNQWKILGFLDDNPDKLGLLIDGTSVLGGIQWLDTIEAQNCQLILAVADVKTKKYLVEEKLYGKNPNYANAIHPTAIIMPGVTLGADNIIGAGVVIAGLTEIGNHITINLNATIGHNCLLEDYCTIAPGANITGRVKIHAGVDIGANASMLPGINIGKWAKVGIGSVLIKDVPDNVTVFGNPARVVG